MRCTLQKIVAWLTVTVVAGSGELRVRVTTEGAATSEAVSIAISKTDGTIRWKSMTTDGRPIDAVAVFNNLSSGRYDVEVQEHHCCDERGKTFAHVIFGGQWIVK